LEDKTKIFVRYSETDQMSFVYHGNYVKYFEIGRIAWLKKLGISYKKMEDDGILLPVVDVKIKFRKPALFDDELILHTKLKQMPSYMIEFEYKISRNNELLTNGYTKLAFFNTKTNKPVRCPKFILDKITLDK
tara:strand:+ start:1300 stop:1698 length:399 start_codon:yes stop_codon:yes gene_type:complete